MEWLLGAIAGVLAGALGGWFLGRARLALKLTESSIRLESERRAWENERALLAAQIDRLSEHQEESANAKFELLKAEFRTLAEKLMTEKSGELRKDGLEQLNAVLTPLKERIGEFRRSIDLQHAKNLEINAGLREQLRLMTETARRVGSEADHLARALKGDNKMQGNWGEMILDELLTGSGLQENIHYFKQASLTDDDGRAIRNDDSDRIMRPDVTVRYPDGKIVLLDSKVSLSAYTDYVNAEDQTARDEALARHLRSVRAHVDELARKNYAAHVRKSHQEAVEFVVMFIPNEAPCQLAMQRAPTLWREAFERKVLIVGPVNLMALLQLIHLSWKRFDQERNQQLILESASQLLDRVYAFYAEFDELGKKLEGAGDAYRKAVDRLRGSDGKRSVVQKAEQLKQLGVKMKKVGKLPARLQIAAADDEAAEPPPDDGPDGKKTGNLPEN